MVSFSAVVNRVVVLIGCRRKVIIALEELGLDYKPVFLDFSKNEQKGAEHTAHNPNGRIPTLVDHKNGDLTVWCVTALLTLTCVRGLILFRCYRRESDAILTYLVEKYDPEHKISFVQHEEKIQQLQWLFFQASGQG